jgi:hypothetical protein
MLKTIGRIILIGLLLVFVLFVLWRCASGRVGLGQTQPEIPLDLKQIIPSSWIVLSAKSATCDYDHDGAAEWLIIYRYDQTTDPSTQAQFNPIGGVIYDAQVNLVPQAPGNESPYRPAFLIPYKLLPDIYGGKGQGYLGESDVQVYTYPVPPQGSPCTADETNILGYSGNPFSAGSPLPTRLSIFRWLGDSVGYSDAHFVGNAQVKATPTFSGPITEVVTYNRLNDRSVLCAVQTFTRPAGEAGATLPPGLEFTEQPALYTIDFCFGAPQDPAYPEGVVVATLRGNNPGATEANAAPTGSSYLTTDAINSLPTQLKSLGETPRTPYPILSVTLPGALGINPGPGYPCPASVAPSPGAQTSQPGTPEAGVWWCAREQAQVTTEVLLPAPEGQAQMQDRPRQVVWSLISMANQQTTADVSWRIDKVELR